MGYTWNINGILMGYEWELDNQQLGNQTWLAGNNPHQKWRLT